MRYKVAVTCYLNWSAGMQCEKNYSTPLFLAFIQKNNHSIVVAPFFTSFCPPNNRFVPKKWAKSSTEI